MSGHLKAAVALVVLGLVAIAAFKLVLPIWQDTEQRATSDAAATKASITVGTDNWIGYFPLCSPTLARRMREAGYALRCEEDAADYAGRFARLEAGTLELAVATVDAYVLNGARTDYPGTIVAVIDESKGGDAIVARRREIGTLEALRTVPEVKIAFTPSSPSEHLLRSIGAHFGIRMLGERRGGWRVETNGSSAAREKLEAGEVQVAVLWEPDVSRALGSREMVKLIGTEDTEGLIVDVLIVNRRFARDNPEVVSHLLTEYFAVLKEYRDHPERLQRDVEERTGLPADAVRRMLGGVAWASLLENGLEWFGLGPSRTAREGLVEAIRSAVQVLAESGELPANPLPDGDPYRITNRQFVSALHAGSLAATVAGPGSATTAEAGADPLSRSFARLDDAGWNRLEEIGTLRVEPIAFQRGAYNLAFEGKLVLDRAMERLKHYPNFRILVKGHTSLSGDDAANRRLSQERADAVARYLVVTFGIDSERIRALGLGSSRPLSRRPGESDRAYGYRLPRVELALVTDIL